MSPIDQTTAFQSVLRDKISSIPSGRSKSPGVGPRARDKGKGKEGEEEEEFLKEAYRVHTHLTSLAQLLQTVRKAYLSTLEPPALSRSRARRAGESSALDGDGQGEGAEWRRWEKVKYLTDRERDEIDLRARMILRRCKERVGGLELAEQARKSKAPSLSHPSALLSFLPSLSISTSPSTSFPPLIAAHRASILWTLNDYLARLTNTVSALQEERSKRREERSTTLGGRAGVELAGMARQRQRQQEQGRKIPDGVMVDVHDPAFSSDPHIHVKGLSNPDGSGAGVGMGMGIVDPSSPPIEDVLSTDQIQSFENENNVLLEHMSSTLSSVLSAESSLLEIAQLQSELVRHLAQQTEMVDQLYEDAVGAVGQMGAANKQLTQARERGKESRLFLLIFLVGASMALLFLDWYAS